MNIQPLYRVIIPFLALSITSVTARTWTNTAGVTIEAEIVEANATKVTIKREVDKKNFELPLSSLSEADQAFVKKWLEEKSAGGGATGSFENWDDPWPKLISTDLDMDIKVVKQDEKTKEYIYHSPHYEFICDVPLTTSVVRRFSVLFEATNDYIQALPLSMEKARSGKRHKIQLFESQNSYFAAGGPPGSAGVYMGGTQNIMVPLTSLGVKKVGSRYQVDYGEGNKTLPHEITHQITDEAYYKLGGWFSEGLSEYVAVTPYRSGKFTLGTIQNTMKAYVTGYGKDGKGGRAIGEEVNLPSLKDWMMQPYSSFLANPQINYGCGALITYYFFEMDGNKDAARIKKALKALKEGKTQEEALTVMLDGRSWDEMEEEITKSWRGRGIKFNFQ